MGHSPISPPDFGPACSSSRTVRRFIFLAVAEIIETATQTCVMGKITKISRKGCYVDILKPFPVGTLLNVVISRDDRSFATKGRVIYAHKGVGMGVAFLDPTDDQLTTLDSLAERPRHTDAL